jgi:hypothetical protein
MLFMQREQHGHERALYWCRADKRITSVITHFIVSYSPTHFGGCLSRFVAVA